MSGPAGDDGPTGGWTVNDASLDVSESTWRIKRDTEPRGCQTDDIAYIAQEVQAAPIGLHKALQTDPEKSELLQPGDPYPPSLFAFFSKVTDPICEMLSENQDPYLNDLFSDYNDIVEDEDNKHEDHVSKTYELRDGKIADGTVASCVGWNRSGGQIAVGYSFPSHEGWCTHLSKISVWNLNRHVDQKVPNIEVELRACVSNLEFHPVENTLMAVGLHSGEVVLVDLSLSTYFMGASGGGEDTGSGSTNSKKPHHDCILDTHGEAHNRQVVSLKWIRLTQGNIASLFQKHPGGSSVALATASADGYIALWSVAKTGSKLYLEKHFIVTSENLSEDIAIGNRFKVGMKEIGVTSMATCKDDNVTIVFSTHGSFVFQGSLLNEIEISDAGAFRGDSDADHSPLMDPVNEVVAKDIGLIACIDCSPFYRNLLLYLTSEGTCVLQNLSQPNVAARTFAQDVGSLCRDVKWSTRPLLFGLTNRNLLLLYDMKEFESTQQATLELEHDEQLTSISFCKSRPELVAVSDVAGTVHVWTLPSGLVTSDNLDQEVDQLMQMGQSESRR